mmetsp:Transcript_38645/g.64875  ORF Transcript_38645/g.64875 Transcript_38645/m.64875 type:complete len:192 (+) Transcript_38645:47-622(+)
MVPSPVSTATLLLLAYKVLDTCAINDDGENELPPPPAFPPLLCRKYGFICGSEQPSKDIVPNPIPSEFTAEILVEKNSANDSATTMEARATLYRYNNASLSEGMITYKYAGGSITIPSTSFSNFNTNGFIYTFGETESGELNCTKKIGRKVKSSCVLQYLGVRFVRKHLSDAFYCRNEDQPGLSSIYYQNM